ncbi:hypothetical protein [Sphingomonas sp. G-3-2-10]|uniref:hypothetical protein n=1 Tax=Sphingomonas sp. G-3-2-10 TaxID=2728838 RepID=UPI00146F120B|nr:hypothetical protein [Sphingomonas sp. G-3-2-10]NML04757.1 hypothetical protein [Sphingomonas sp. G-3-2-10]
MFSRFLFAAPLILFAVPAAAQDAQDGPPKRVRSVITFGDEKCPPATDPDEIVVCASGGDSPYRIPKRFRNQPAEGPAAQSWSRRVEVVEEVNRAGLPNSCSPIGTGGQSGCTRQMIRQWYQERLETEAKRGREMGPEE